MSKVYLSGPIAGLSYGDATYWREDITDVFKEYGIEALSPMRGKRFLRSFGELIDANMPNDNPLVSDNGITARDRFDVQRCDMMLVNLLNTPRVSIGTMIELGWADAARIPIVLVMSPANLHNHPIVRAISAYITDDLDEGVDIILTALGRQVA